MNDIPHPDKQTNITKAPRTYKFIAAGLVVFALLLGISLVTTLFSFSAIDQYWPVLIVLAGLVMATNSPKSAPAGILVVLLGMLVIASKQNWLSGTAGHVIEIFLLLILALVILVMSAPKHKL